MGFSGTERFELRGVLGEGSMGVVYEALDRARQHPVALKRLRSLGPEELFRFKNEFRALQDLHHRNVVDLGELIEVDGTWFFTMELVEGDDFLSYVRPDDADFDEARLRDVLAQLARGLDAIHEAGLVHRDLKPSNIRITDEGRAVILDFGLAAEPVAPGDESITVVGTAAYMAPEQAASKPLGPPADWYAVGALLYEAMTGRLPFDGAMLEVLMAKQHREPDPPTRFVPDLPGDLVELCSRALSFDPAARPTGNRVLDLLGADRPSLATGSLPATAPFVGRDPELAALRRAFDDVRGGRAVTVEVRGDSGVGKSALIQRFTRRLAGEEERLVVLRGRCYERETVPYKALDGVVDALASHLRKQPMDEVRELVPRHAALLPRVFPVLGRVEAIADAADAERAVVNPHELRERVFSALRELLAALCRRRPVVVVIDDMQWTDVDSLLLLDDLLRPPGTPAMLLLLSSREEVGDRALPGDLRQVQLAPLDPDDARRLAELLLLRAGSEVGTAEVLAREAAGHPLFLHELVRHIALAGDEVPRAARLDDAVWSRAALLPDSAREVLELICVAGSPLSEEVVSLAAAIDRAELAKQVGLLRTAHLIRGRGEAGRDSIEPYHDRIRETVSERLDADRRASRHGRIGRALELAGIADSRPELALRHFRAAGDLERAARYAAAAAARATEGLAFDRAAELWQVALDLGDHDAADTRNLRIGLADALAATGRGREAAEEYLIAIDDADPLTRLDCRRKAAEHLLSSGYIERGLSVLQELLGELGAALPDSPRRALVSLAWHRMRLRLRGLRWQPREATAVPEAELIRIDAYHAVSHGLGIVDTIRGMDFQARALLLALRAGEPVRVAIALLQEAGFRAASGGRHIERARPLLEEARVIADAADDPYLTAWRVGVDGVVQYMDSRFESARHALADSERILRGIPGAHWEQSSIRLFVVLDLKLLGALKRIGQLAERYLRDAQRRGDRFTETSIRVLACWRWLVRDDPDGAVGDLENTSWAPPEGGFHLQHFWKLEAQAEVALYSGRAAEQYDAFVRESNRHARSLLSRIHMVRCAELGLRGRMALASAAEGVEPSARRAVARRVARKLAREPGGFPRAWAATLRAAIAHQRGDTDRAVAELRAAEEIVEAHDMAWWLASIRYRLGALVGGDDGAALTDEATRWLRAEGVARPDRMVRVLTPGFD